MDVLCKSGRDLVPHQGVFQQLDGIDESRLPRTVLPIEPQYACFVIITIVLQNELSHADIIEIFKAELRYSNGVVGHNATSYLYAL